MSCRQNGGSRHLSWTGLKIFTNKDSHHLYRCPSWVPCKIQVTAGKTDQMRKKCGTKCTYNIKTRRIRVNIFAVEKQYFLNILFVCMCVCYVCVCVCERERESLCMCFASVMRRAKRIYSAQHCIAICGLSGCVIFLTHPIKGTIFEYIYIYI